MFESQQSHFAAKPRGAARGYIHVLLLVLMVLGITMWGLSELLQKSIEQKNEAEKLQDINQFSAKRALLNYALTPPPTFHDHGRPGWYSAYQLPGKSRPYRRFFLPCPANSEDGISGIHNTTVDMCFELTNYGGYLPWREFSGTTNNRYEYTRGLGEDDFNEGYRKAHRYTLSHHLNNNRFSLNPHRLLRLTTGWLSVRVDGELLSDRAVAVISSPDERLGGDIEQDEYITIDDLVGASGSGVAQLENPGADNIYDFINGDGDAFGVIGLLENHLNRYGYLPEPAVFANYSAERRRRPAGSPTQFFTTVTGDFGKTGVLDIQGMKIDSSGLVTTVFRVKDLPPVYLERNSNIPNVSSSDPAMAAPYNIPLSYLQTELNTPSSVLALALASLTLSGDYPLELFGLTLTVSSGGLLNVDSSNRQLIPLRINSAVAISIGAGTGSELNMRLASRAYGYFQASVLTDVVSFIGDSNADDITRLPPYAAKVVAPAGTRFTVDVSTTDINLVLPANFQFNGTFDPSTQSWQLSTPVRQAIRIDSPADVLVTAVVPNDWVVAAGDVGFLPIGTLAARTLDNGLRVSLSGNAISDLASEMVLYSESELTLVPFPPPGRPAPAFRGQLSGSPLPTPLIIPANTEFSIPVGGRVIYPTGSSFMIGDNFVFPDQAIAQYPAGAEVRVVLPPDSIYPGGGPSNPAITVNSVSMPFGGVLQLRNVRPVTEGPGVIGVRQRLFDIELRGDAAVYNSSSVIVMTLSQSRVVRPFSGRYPRDEAILRLADNSVLSGATRTRAKFLTAPRRIVLPDVNQVSVYSQRASVSISFLSAPDTITPSTLVLDLDLDENIEFLLPAGFELPILRSSFPTSGGAVRVVDQVTIPADTAIFAPANQAWSDAIYNEGNDAEAILLANDLILTLASSIVDVSVIALATVTATVDGAVRGIVQRRLALFPETDMYVFPFSGAGVTLIPAGSIVDVLEGVVHQPVGVQRVPYVADDLQMLSNKQVQIYFDSAATLEIGAGFENYQVATALTLTAYTRDSTNLSVEMSYLRFSSLTPRIVTESNILSVGSQLRVPPSSYILVPGGEAVDFLSNQLSLAGAAVGASDYANLPDSAVLVILPGSTLSAVDTAGAVNSIEGPAYVRLSGEVALINHPARLSSAPLIFLTSSGYLVDGKSDIVLKENIYAPIAAASRLDIYGNLERRGDLGFHGALMPIDNATFLRDFPMVYAVAPECREGVLSDGICGSGEGEGLDVELQDGDEYVLKNELIASSAVYVTTNVLGLGVAIEVSQIGSTVIIQRVTVQSLQIADDGMVIIDPAGSYTPATNDRLILRAVDNSATSTRRAELRSYLEGNIQFANPINAADLANHNYIAVDDSLTVFVGGFIGNNYAAAVGKTTLPANLEFDLSHGSRLAGVREGQRPFGTDSRVAHNFGNGTVTVDLDDFVMLNPRDYEVILSLSADTSEVDLFGSPYAPPFRAGEVMNFIAGLGQVAPSSALIASRPITVRMGSKISMEPGYLWQGYMSAQQPVVFSESAQSNNPNKYTSQVHPDGWPSASVYLRVQSTVESLNLWGSGLERPEIIDGYSEAAVAVTSLGMSVSLALLSPLPQSQYSVGLLAALPNNVSSLAITVIVRDLYTSQKETVVAWWRPVAVNSTSGLTLMSALRWNRKNNPLPGDVYDSYGGARGDFDTDDIWGGRLVTTSPPDLHQEDAYIDGFECRGVAAQVPFNPPHFQLVANDAVPVGVAWEIPYYGSRANVLTNGFAATPANPNSVVFEPRQFGGARPQYQPILTTGGYTATVQVSTAVGLSGRSIRTTLGNDTVIYLDRAYHPQGGIPQELLFGDEFLLEGPGALVPPFSGDNIAAVKNVYAQRSKLMGDLFGYPELGSLYSSLSASCVSITPDCPAMFGNADWFPILNGVIAFEGINVSIDTPAISPTSATPFNDEVRFIMPQPEAIVQTESGLFVTIYAGSIIYPRRRVIYPSNPLPAGNYELFLPSETGGFGGVEEVVAFAAVDVSPAMGANPVRLLRSPDGVMLAGDFNYSPSRFKDLPSAGVASNGCDPINPLPFCDTSLPPPGANIGCIVEPVAFANATVIDWNNRVSVVFDGISLTASYSGVGVQDDVLRYDGSFSRGVLLNDEGTDIMLSYYQGNNRFTLTNYTSAAGLTNTIPLYNTDIALGNPQSYRWSSGARDHFLPIGSQRNSTTATVSISINSTLVGVSLRASGEEFFKLRLAHRIEIPGNSRLEFSGYRGGLEYPLSEDAFFEFPRHSRAQVLNTDAGSWVSAHPYLAVHQQGIRVRSDISNPFSPTLTVGIVRSGLADIGGINTFTVSSNDGFSSYDVGNRRVLHYQRSDSAPGAAPLSSAPIHTNVWIRIPRGGRLLHLDTGVEIVMPDHILLNPILGTYLFDRGPIFRGSNAGSNISRVLENNYLTKAILVNPITVSRPALIIPAGGRLAVGRDGGFIRNVQALVMFSLSPLDRTECPIGEFGPLEGQYSALNSFSTETINQLREGVSEDAYENTTGQPIGIGHPCMWLDNPENLDGDRLYVYRSRRRYAGNLETRVLTNDRTYLLGGKLVL